jgi:hypothetical protein
MLLKIAGSAAMVLILILPARLLAGGPPWLCLPLDGVTAENATACGELLTSKLADKLCPYPGRDRAVKVQENKGQWYVAFYLGEHAGLHDVEAALAGSEFSVPRERLRLFGHAILVIDARAKSKQLLEDLEALSLVSVAESKTAEGRLLVTVDMPYPYPVEARDREELTVGWDSFWRGDLSSDQATRSEAPATARALPGHDEFRKTVEKHDAMLTDIRWSPDYVCRPLGCVSISAAPAAESK